MEVGPIPDMWAEYFLADAVLLEAAQRGDHAAMQKAACKILSRSIGHLYEPRVVFYPRRAPGHPKKVD